MLPGSKELVMKRENAKKLVLNRETVRALTSKEMRAVAGGMINLSRMTQCDCAPQETMKCQSNTHCFA
jgi:hypothetical protein